MMTLVELKELTRAGRSRIGKSEYGFSVWNDKYVVYLPSQLNELDVDEEYLVERPTLKGRAQKRIALRVSILADW